MGAGTADGRYRSCQGLDYMRCLEANDIAFGDIASIAIFGSEEYKFADFTSQSVDKNQMYWVHMWQLVTKANQLLFYLDDETIESSLTLKKVQSMGIGCTRLCI